eukprot:11188889-Lingulodinium_polyedra.AAC.1
MKRGDGTRADVYGAWLGEHPYHAHVCARGAAKFRPRGHSEVALARSARGAGVFVDVETRAPELYC